MRGRPVDTAAVVQNLFVNARRYAPGSVITVNATERDGRVEILVEDSGPGIPERERASVFERGVRGSTSRGVEGTGLGLFVSRRLMAEQHGSLRLRAGAAGGACFVLELPAAERCRSRARRMSSRSVTSTTAIPVVPADPSGIGRSSCASSPSSRSTSPAAISASRPLVTTATSNARSSPFVAGSSRR